jgi:uncharacterized protein
VGVWLVTVAGAYALERAGRRGPAEVLLRRLAYRGTGRGSSEGAPGGDGTGPPPGPGGGKGQERTTP